MAGSTSETRTIEVFRPGTFVPMGGGALAFSAEDLAAIAADYDPEAAPAPVVVGHPSDNDPAFGWAAAFRWDEAAGRLLADIGDLAAEFVAAVADGRYRKVSLSLFRPDSAANPKPGRWYPRHIGFLGGAAPAVPGLKPVTFAAADEAVTIELGEPALKDVSGLFRGIRDWMIEKFGLETADRVVPDWQIRWLDEAAGHEPPQPASPAFAAPADPTTPTPEVPMPTKPASGDPAADAADFAARETALVARTRALDHREHESFAEALVAEGRLIPALKDRAVGLLDGLDAVTEISFSEGGKEAKAPQRQALRDLLAAMPKAIVYGGVVPKEGGSQAAAAEFAAPEGKTVDRERADIHGKAVAYQRQHPGTSFLDAVKAVDPSA